MQVEGLTNENELAHIIGVIETNSHEIYNRRGYCYRGVYSTISFLSHNCIVNCRPKVEKEAPFINTVQANIAISKGNKILAHLLDIRHTLKSIIL